MKLQRKRVDDPLGLGLRERHWVVLGPKGAVEYRELLPQHLPLGIEVHSPTDPNNTGEEPHPCQWLETGCYVHGSACAADRLRRRYRDSGDEEDIWRELERWYREAFEGSRS